MKILMVTPYVPYPPSSGGQIRTFNLLKHLSQGNEITLVALYKNQKEKDYYSYLKSFCKKIYLCQRPEKPWVFKNIFKTIFSSSPFLVVRNFSDEAKEIISKLLEKEKFDVIHAETFYVMPHIPKTNTPIVLVEQTIEYNVYKHFVNSLPFYLRMLLYFDIDIIKLRYWERFYWKKANIVVAVSSPDEKIIKNEEEEIKTSVIPNGAGDEMIVSSLGKKDLKKLTVFFQGNFFWLQNVEAAKFLINKIYPLLTKNNPNINVVIAGQNAGKIGKVNFKKIKIVDISSDDTQKVKKLFREADLFIAPIFGPGGTRLKILAAMGSGIPVISTETGVEGLDVIDNIHVLTAKTPLQFVEKIEKILSDKGNYEKIRKNALLLVKSKYQWQGIANKLETVYKNL
ncbi:MAG: glycosyl transferase family 1 protein [Candidatus Roizmanbacteria bacterium GW2011_GWA2_35_19]|uniref:Glycosyl transferase family 1 protein n=2 Tax=Candidatus Roizmaniibacteriota TaxID=1752723 RepID=A0A0G0CEF9_9BACT|nr:MAG: glycosyl transferase family 1 protein [Candidatus Roizmanbacteria bacterium GW2011_GWC2_35_12]KKP74466.1 MAG: glycosyl transferase family 1 protein [Candidatus Roizmanbacteria bacterium GW2011_GWA2_35_19]